MPFYVIDSIFTQPFDTFGDTVAAHRAYLQQGYDSGLLLPAPVPRPTVRAVF